MTATSQPIALPVSSNASDSAMLSDSYMGTNGSMNPASWCQYLGSPPSWRPGSLGNRYYTGCSPSQLLGPLDPNDFKFGQMSSSVESDRGSIHNAINVLNREDELVRPDDLATSYLAYFPNRRAAISHAVACILLTSMLLWNILRWPTSLSPTSTLDSCHLQVHP
jgi:hypothetical protein